LFGFKDQKGKLLLLPESKGQLRSHSSAKMAQTWPESIAEFFKTLLMVVFFWLEAVVKFFIPRKFYRKDVSGQKVLITGAGA
jgi:hypothetical protein